MQNKTNPTTPIIQNSGVKFAKYSLGSINDTGLVARPTEKIKTRIIQILRRIDSIIFSVQIIELFHDSNLAKLDWY
jgi:hypothetical protein